MISSISLNTLASGLGVQSRAVQTAADNIVNVTTEGYQAEQGQVVSKPLQGASYVPLPSEGPVDLGQEVVNLIRAKQTYAATAHAFSSIAKTEKRGLDVVG
ncbi:conserved hypothetical protein [Candidatus Terasakiella magnetica]|nr:conserved hypothetical protein [Candidatus Terasakiella magnetica]